MELNIFKVLLCHRKHISRVSKEHITSFLVLSHILVLPFLEILQFRLVVALDPASLIQVHRFPTSLGIILIL